MNTKKVIVIGGPTAVGKSLLAIKLAKYLNTEIISADSRQFYKELFIGVNKPSKFELKEVKHHLIGHISIKKNYSVGQFEKEALEKITEKFKKINTLILCGGSGLYIDAVCEGLHKFPKVSQKIKNEIYNTYQKKGLEYLQEELKNNDEESFKKIDIQNPHRVMRVLSIFRASQIPYSNFIKNEKVKRDFNISYISLTMPRDKLYSRIDQRVNKMLEDGLINEVKSLYKFKNKSALKTIGYKEIFSHLDKKISIQEAVNEIKKNSRRYAKRQITWFSRKKYTQIQMDELKIDKIINNIIGNNLINEK